jgi:hypothetical protein
MRMRFPFGSGHFAAHALLSRTMWLAAAAALLLAGCQTAQQGPMAAAQPRGATIAFESIDGLPPYQFHTLVEELNREAQTRQLPVQSRLQPAAYRVRGYFAASVERGRTTVSWVWDVFDRNQRRALRISGSAPAQGRDWNAADPRLLQKVAQSSMDELAGFLNSPAVASDAPSPPTGPALALANDGSPEAAGIFRVAHTDPVQGNAASPQQPSR